MTGFRKYDKMAPNSGIVHEKLPVLLVGGGELDEESVNAAKAFSPVIVAADRGAARCAALGLTPVAVIGDMDSIDDPTIRALPREAIHRIPEQDSTDFDKALRNITAPVVLGLGFTGARLDHELAAFNVLVRHPARRCVLIGARDVVFLCPPALEIDLPVGTRFSLFPMGAVEGASVGLRWPIDGLVFAPDGRVGTSNEVTGPVRIDVTAPKMLVMLPVDALGTVVRSLEAQSAYWT